MTDFRRRVVSVLGACALAVALPLVASPSSAATFDVTNTNDSGAGSLREALLDAEAAGDDTVAVQAGLGTINAMSPLEWCGNGTTTIEGNGVAINMNNSPSGLVDTCGSAIVVEEFSITGVGGTSTEDAAPIVTEGGGIVLRVCTISGNVVTATDDSDVSGGVLSDGGGIVIEDCAITGNVATTEGGDSTGGVWSNGGGVTVARSDISANSATSNGNGDSGGGINSSGGGITIRESAISFNTAESNGESGDDAGGGMQSEGGGVTVTGSEVNCNVATATEDAAGAVNSEGGGVTVQSSDVIGNSATSTGGGIAENDFFTDGGGLTVTDSTVSDDTSGCAAPPPPPPPPPSTPTFSGPAAATPVSAQARFTG